MSGSIRIIQISDCHLSADTRQDYRGINPHDNLRVVLQRAEALQPDLLLATGDLSEDGSRASYRALQAYFEPLAVPVLALPGNHDDAGLLAGAFAGSPVDKISVSEHGPWHIIRLNSALPGRPEGRLSAAMLAELGRYLQGHPDHFHLIAVHHQPVAVDSPWIDKYPLLEPQAFLQVIDQCPGVKAVVWGHIHQVFESRRNGITMLGSPSSAINGLRDAQHFTADPHGPACRWLELKPDGGVQSGIAR